MCALHKLISTVEKEGAKAPIVFVQVQRLDWCWIIQQKIKKIVIKSQCIGT